MKKLLFFIGTPVKSTAIFYRVGLVAKYLDKNKYKIKVLAVCDNEKDLAKVETFEGLEIENISLAHYKMVAGERIKRSSFAYLFSIFKTYKKIKEIALKYKPDLIHTFSSSPISIFCAYLLKRKFVVSVDIDDLTVEQAKMQKFNFIYIKILEIIEYVIPKRFNLISVNSSYLKNIFSNSIKIPNMVELEKFKINLSELEKENLKEKYKFNEYDIIFLSGISLYHGHFDILPYLKNISCKFIFVGEGEGLVKLKKIVEKNNLPVIFTGKLDKNEVIKVLQIVKKGILPMKNLPIHLARFPLKLLEYMASSTCVISSNVGEAKLILDSTNAIVEETYENLVKKAVNLPINEAENLSKNAYNKVKEFDVENVIKLWEEFYDKIL